MMELNIRTKKANKNLVIGDLEPNDVFCFLNEYLKTTAQFENGDENAFENLDYFLRTDSDDSIVCLSDGEVYPIWDEEVDFTNRAVKKIKASINVEIEI